MTNIHFSREPLSLKINKTIFALVITLGLMIVILAVLFLTMVSSSGQKGYLLKELQIQNNQLQTENEKLKTELTEKLSFQKIENTEKVKEMTKPEAKVFITK